MATAHVCIKCKESKERDGFYIKQWKLQGGGLCKLCWDDKQGNKRPASDALSPEEVEAKRIKLEEKKQKKEEKMKRIQEEQARRAAEEKPNYYLTYGVGYDSPRKELIRFKNEPLSNESLLGTYKHVYYSSNDDGGEEDIHRTARGMLKLSEVEWSSESVLLGRYIVDTEKTNGKVVPETGFGEHPMASLIEMRSGWSVPEFWNGFNIMNCRDKDDKDEDSQEPDEFYLKQGRKEFVVCRGEQYCSYDDTITALVAEKEPQDWWTELDQVTDDDDDGELHDEFCGAVLKVVAKRHALGFSPDKLCDIEYEPKNIHTSNIFSQESEKLEQADKLMALYKDGSNSWMCRHLNVPSEVAFKIREYVTPPPVFFVEENDLMLVVEESLVPEFERVLVFRKEES